MAPSLKLVYFDLPGRAETARIMLNIAKIPFDDHRISREEFAEYKPKSPFGQLPVLEVDGKMLAQTHAIDRYVAQLCGLYPTDPWEQAKVDESKLAVYELLEAFIGTFSIKDAEEKLAARKVLVEGAVHNKLTKINDILAAAGPEGFMVGPKMTLADIDCFSICSFLVSGFLDGVPTDLLSKYPAIKALHTRIGSLPEVKAMYESVTEGIRLAYKV